MEKSLLFAFVFIVCGNKCSEAGADEVKSVGSSSAAVVSGNELASIPASENNAATK